MRALSLLLLTGCYMEAGLGGAGGLGTVHGSAGVIAHFGDAGSGHVGVGGSYGPYQPSDGTGGNMTALPVAAGVDVVMFARGKHQLIASSEWDLPVLGQVYLDGTDSSISTITAHGILGAGYRYRVLEQNGDERGSISICVGPEVWYASESVDSSLQSSTTFGFATSFLAEVRAAAIARWFD